MKSYILGLSALLLLVGNTACKSPIDIPYTDAKQVLTILFLGSDQEQDEHKVYISRTNMGQYNKVRDAKVKITIDGKQVPVQIVAKSNDPLNPRPDVHYQFEAKFAPGQTVEIQAEAEGKTASSSLVVPNPGKLLDVTKEDFELNEYGSQRKRYRWKIGIQDRPGEDNYYYITARTHIVHQDVETGQEIILFVRPKPIELDGREDFIISDGNPSNGNSSDPLEELLGTEIENKYNAFSDKRFKDRSATLTLTSESVENLYLFVPQMFDETIIFSEDKLMIGQYNPETQQIKYHTPRDSGGYRFKHINIDFELHSITRDAYRYLISLGVLNSSDGESPFTTPVQLHSNISSGAGIFSVSTVAKRTFTFRPKPRH